ncbi:MAG: ABC transporter substrate-binding protein [Candidatus Baldrarchaeia archaeon]
MLKKKLALAVSLVFIGVLAFSMIPPSFAPNGPIFKFPRCDMLRMRTIDDDYAARDMALDGEMDMVIDIVIPEILDDLTNAGFTIDQQDGFHLCRIAIDCRDYKCEDAGKYYSYHYAPGDPNYPLNLSVVRQALHYLTDKSIIYTVLDGIVTEAYTAVPPAIARWYYPGVTPFPFDPTKAKDLLENVACWHFGDGGIYVPDPSKWSPGDPCPTYPDDYIPLRPLYFMFPSHTIAPTTFQVCDYICDTWND